MLVAAILYTVLQMQQHDPEDLIWRRVDDRQQPNVIIMDPRTQPLLFIRGDMVAGFRQDRVGGVSHATPWCLMLLCAIAA